MKAILRLLLTLSVMGSLLASYFLIEKNKEKITMPRVDFTVLIRATWIGKAEQLIQSSTIKRFIPYNVSLHIVLSVIAYMQCFFFMIRIMPFIVSAAFGLLGFAVPTLVLSAIADLMQRKNRVAINEYMHRFANEFSATNNIFKAIDETYEKSKEPMRTYILELQKERNLNHKADEVLINFKNRVGSPEFDIFIENLIHSYTHGGNAVTLANSIASEMNALSTLASKEDSEDFMMKMLLYFVIIMNLAILIGFMNAKYGVMWARSIWAQVTLIIDFIIVLKLSSTLVKSE